MATLEITYLLDDPSLTPEELIRLYASVGWNPDGIRTVPRVVGILNATFCHACARVDGQLAGFGRVLADGFCGQLLDVMTHPDHRNRGIATRIVEMLVESTSDRLVSLHLINGTGRGGRFYERFGFMAADSKTDRLMYRSPTSTSTP